MAKLGSEQNPLVVRVRTERRMTEVAEICESHGWKFIIGIEPDKPEDICDIERLLNPSMPSRTMQIVGRNDACPCGSGRKYKKCCGK